MKELEKVMAVQRMQNYIENNLNRNITLLELSQCSNYSPWYSAKLFKEYIGKGPFEYIRLMRLTKSALELRDNDKRVVDVALDFVFDSHEGFTRAFKKEFGITPKKYKKDKPPIYLYTPYPIKEQYMLNKKIAKNNENKVSENYFVQIMNFPQRKFILKRGIKAKNYFEYVNEVGCEIWGLLCSIKEALNEPIGVWLPEKFITEGTSVYVQGVEVPIDYCGIVPEGLEIITLPSCKMMVFQGEPFEDEDYDIAIKNISKAISKYNPSLYGYEWATDKLPSFQMEPQGYRGYIEGHPVREI